MQCPRHPGSSAEFRCEKYDVMMCEKCMECRSPKTHCKHRRQCIIWRLVEEKFGAGDSERLDVEKLAHLPQFKKLSTDISMA
ncbi:MAG: hypothetical protein C4520_02760 [Candidatus Abyssobacteria bacterium SURF_5]|uniref:Uncharacterized protein n=1 Tax=Abyssobacteria bacterium (strain SURF_5) TaxID=2093360 RepID=A0A3A4P3N2_ABYX5|nr:MAG: hypothetical protein C4520_02760 [Candidatus Abyssubacteria bacterium SURF_5]